VDDTFSDFQEGDTTTSTLSDQGFLTIPPFKEKVYDPAHTEVFWDAAVTPDGRVFLGSGHQGNLFEVDQNSSGTLLANTGLLEIYAVSLDPDGAVLVAGAPNGQVVKVASRDELTTFSATGAQYVWALRRSPAGDLLAATGTKGKIFKIDSEGKATEFCEIKQAKNVLDLAFDAEGRLLATTESKGMLVRIDEKGKAFVLYESDLEEIRRVAVSDDGDLWLAVNGEKSTGGGGEGGPSGGKTPSPAELAAMLGGPGGPGEDMALSRPPSRRPSSRGGPGRGAPSKVVLLSPEGFVRLAWTPPDSPVYDIVPDQGGRAAFVVAGNSGGLYHVDRLGHSKKITAVREKGMVRLLRLGDGNLLALTNGEAVVYRIDPSRSTDGIFVSRVLDAEDPVQWGRALIDATVPTGAEVLFSTRSGNTGDPEHHWTEWSKELKVIPDKGMKISSSPSRRIQYRLRMAAASAEESGWPKVDKVEIPFSAPNQPPEITEVTVKPEFESAAAGKGGRGLPPGLRNALPGGDSPGGSKGPSGAGGPSKPGAGPGASEAVTVEADSNAGKMAVSWKAEDPNDDELRFKISIRPESDETWVLLEEDVEGDSYSIDSMALPDGRYRVRVVATDLPSNLPGQALTAEDTSDPFEVDNTPPEVRNLASEPGPDKSVGITFTGVDETTRIRSAQWRINGRDWRFLAPEDAIFDSKSETFKFAIPEKDFEGEKSAMVTVRATDERGNTGVGLIRVQIAP